MPTPSPVTSLVAQVQLLLQTLLTGTNDGWDTPSVQTAFPGPKTSFTYGNAGSGQVDLVYQANLHLSSGWTSLNLTDGSLKDDLGNALVFTVIRAIAIYNAPHSSGTLGQASGKTVYFGGNSPGGNVWVGWCDTSAGARDVIEKKIPVGGTDCFVNSVGFPVTAGDKIWLYNDDGTNQANVYISVIGSSGT